MSTLETLISQVESMRGEAAAALEGAGSLEVLRDLQTKYLGKSGSISGVMKELGKLAPEQRPQLGAKVNEARTALEAVLKNKQSALETAALDAKLQNERIDVTLPGRLREPLAEHPVQMVQDELVEILARMGFLPEIGPEIEHEFFNFDALNIPPTHPSRAMQDTFYIKGREGVVLRTHTSPVQIRRMMGHKPPFRMSSPGRVYRADYDATHAPMFHQIEGLWVDRGIHMGDLKGVLAQMTSDFFGSELNVRLRPSFFPFTEPSAEVDIQCCFCKGGGCKVCKGSGWIEIGGCGMVDPEVFRAVGIDTDTYTGFAFGMGLERMAMLKYDINDLRAFFESDRRFISQFSRWRS